MTASMTAAAGMSVSTVLGQLVLSQPTSKPAPNPTIRPQANKEE
ncbi:MAG: hypothetical protein WKF73_11905 [Nocardioidaceae bacterium]